ncbi:lycopene cyclase domain-containing protein [Amycolatopsis carbonis]|uniref:Lycopene cyclase domain-containing protein n=1 Tax=Amycolatopsis carbonis TaxID=715471 RepID=A0A9Y2IB76_9PSEU|nr:lycopene cyclase domain-containing protein [Amycolatopsis sp. 2-15]WIX76882.1 lycopene cyclase domain-containing protein [Amycolatopsis sp. 2-15]
MIPWGYTVPAVAAVLAVVALELLALRTGLFRKPGYWITIAVVTGFQIPVDGWLTKTSRAIVRYSPEHISGLRFPWDIPIEDFLFGYALVMAVLLLWERAAQKEDPE